MKSIFLLLSVLFFLNNANAQFLSNQTDARGLKQGKWLAKYPDGKTRYEGSFRDNKPIGEWKRYHENGKLKANLYYNESSDKIKAELFDANGSLFAKGNFIGKDKDSIWTFYDNGKIITKESYLKGVKNGKTISFSPEGKIITETPWLNGKIDGVQKEYYPTGTKKSETVYRQGKRQGECRVYFPTGQMQIEGTYLNDAYDGNWLFYNERGAVKLKMTYKNGVLQNPGEYDRIQLQEFQMLEKMRGKIKDPEQYKENPAELFRK